MTKGVLSSLAVWGRLGALVTLSLLAASALVGQAPESVRILSHVRDLRQMSSADASGGALVRIKGSVTALSGWKNSFFLQDASGGISVDRSDDADVHAGDEVEVTGVSGPGLFAPIILANHVQVLGRKRLPPARPASYADLAGGKQDSQRIELSGVVHSANVSESWGRPVLFVVVDIGGGSITARVHEFPRKDFKYLVDATVRMRGVSGTTFNEKRQFIGARLFVPSLDDVQVEQNAPADSFAIPASTIQSLLRFGSAEGLSHRVRVSGILTGQRPGHTLYLQSGSEGIVVETAQTTRLELGARVEAVGFVVPGRYSPALHEAAFRKIEQSAVPPAVHVAAADVIQVKDGFPFAPWNGLLVQLDGEIIDRTQHAGEEVWIMRDGDKVFQGQIQTGADTDAIARIANGSRVRVTGICIIEVDEDQQPRSFRIVLRSARDVAVLREPRLTIAQFLLIAGGLILLSLGTLGWIVRLRRPLPIGSTQPARNTVKLHEYCRWWARVAGLLTGCLGLIVLLGGWACNIAILRSVLPGYAAMRPATALGLVLLGLALWLNDEDKAGIFKRCIVQICAGVPLLIGVVTLLECVLGTNLYMGELMFRNSVLELAPGRMAMMTAVDLVLLGSTLLFSYQRKRFVVNQYFVVIAGSFGLFNIIGYLYGIKSFYGLAFHTGPFFTTAMALHTAGAFMVLSAGILISRPDWGVMATITSEAPGGVLARRLLPCALVIPAALGWLRWQGQLNGLYDTAFGLTLFTSSNIVIFAFMIWRSGILLNRLDLARSGAESNLRESETSFRLLADAMPQIVWTSKPDGNLDYYNQRWYDYTGMTLEKTRDWGWKSVLHPDDLENCIDRWTRAFTTGGPYEVEYRFRRAADSVYRWHLGRGVPVVNAEGKIVRWFGTCTDIEDYKQAEAENRLLNEQLEDRVRRRTGELETANQELRRFSHQLEESNTELQDFASVASHDLQEPLRKVQVFGSRLKNAYGAALDTQGRDYLERMLNATRRMQSLVQDLLAYSRVASRALPFEAVDLSLVTREVLSDLEVRIAETSALVEVGDLPSIQADPVQMRQLLQNLIGNALKFHKEEQSPIVRVHAGPAAHDGFFRLIVEDNGIGFDEKYLDRIFTVFQRLHGRAEYEGTGIGLAVCRKIAYRHGGEITAMSAPGQGATFVVTLPRQHTIHQVPEFSDLGADMNQMTVLSAR